MSWVSVVRNEVDMFQQRRRNTLTGVVHDCVRNICALLWGPFAARSCAIDSSIARWRGGVESVLHVLVF